MSADGSGGTITTGTRWRALPFFGAEAFSSTIRVFVVVGRCSCASCGGCFNAGLLLVRRSIRPMNPGRLGSLGAGCDAMVGFARYLAGTREQHSTAQNGRCEGSKGKYRTCVLVYVCTSLYAPRVASRASRDRMAARLRVAWRWERDEGRGYEGNGDADGDAGVDGDGNRWRREGKLRIAGRQAKTLADNTE
jgi:hypothetical protein